MSVEKEFVDKLKKPLCVHLSNRTGMVWNVHDKENCDHWFSIVEQKTGMKLEINLNLRDKKYFVRGDYLGLDKYCFGLKYDEQTPSIGISMTKTPEQVAVDIMRRFMDDYVRHHQMCREVVTKRTAHENYAKMMRDKISGWCGVPIDRSGEIGVYADDGHIGFKASLHGGQEKPYVEIELRALSLTDAAMILTWVKKKLKNAEVTPEIELTGEDLMA